ncbi:putative glycosyltransferase auxiliary protein [Streptomyces albireticuli]|uniref:Putative glycosyltransferase auxiliary protein n=1 Tax=Streptomyces albireticuli TaxID=1940 RepID=A0A1Z2KZ25_9ACTN|nr:P450-derived glycosyltransferase activator [Streptomyces albireticuli]ARZ67309.1 putative glycosyltransferase auxiliary protein [Streptomyces albireticuli]
MPITATDDATRELGRRLQLSRAGQWFAGNQGDPYALILRAGTDHPAPYEDLVRAQGPWYRSDRLGTWVTADPATAAAVLSDPRFGTRDRAGARPDADLLPLARAFPGHERAELSRLRAAAGPVLGHTALADGSCDAPGAARRLLRRHLPAEGTGFDLVADLARPFTTGLVLRVLGVPEGGREAAAGLLARCAPQLDARFTPQTLAVARDSAGAVQEVAGLVTELVAASRAKGRAHPDDAVGRLLRDGLAPRDVEGVALLLALGVPEPAATAVAATVLRLLARPGDWAAAGRPPAAAEAVDRTLREEPPFRLESRVAHEDVELAGRRVPADGHVVVLATAGRDLPGPDPLGGPDGPHFALALPLVRLAATTAVQALAAALPGLSATGPALTRPRSPVLRAYARCPVRA